MLRYPCFKESWHPQLYCIAGRPSLQGKFSRSGDEIYNVAEIYVCQNLIYFAVNHFAQTQIFKKPLEITHCDAEGWRRQKCKDFFPPF